jgi:hypothetical protein
MTSVEVGGEADRNGGVGRLANCIQVAIPRAVNAAWPPRESHELFRANTDSRNCS